MTYLRTPAQSPRRASPGPPRPTARSAARAGALLSPAPKRRVINNISIVDDTRDTHAQAVLLRLQLRPHVAHIVVRRGVPLRKCRPPRLTSSDQQGICGEVRYLQVCARREESFELGRLLHAKSTGRTHICGEKTAYGLLELLLHQRQVPILLLLLFLVPLYCLKSAAEIMGRIYAHLSSASRPLASLCVSVRKQHAPTDD